VRESGCGRFMSHEHSSFHLKIVSPCLNISFHFFPHFRDITLFHFSLLSLPIQSRSRRCNICFVQKMKDYQHTHIHFPFLPLSPKSSIFSGSDQLSTQKKRQKMCVHKYYPNIHICTEKGNKKNEARFIKRISPFHSFDWIIF